MNIIINNNYYNIITHLTRTHSDPIGTYTKYKHVFEISQHKSVEKTAPSISYSLSLSLTVTVVEEHISTQQDQHLCQK